MSNLEALPTNELIALYEAERHQKSGERDRLHNALGWRVFQESPAPRAAGLKFGGICYTLDGADELVRHVGVYRREYTRPIENTSKVCNVAH